jgi:hypothetical protein
MWRNRSTQRKGNLSVILFNKTFTWTAIGSNPDFFSEKLLTIPPEPLGLRIPVTLGYSMAAVKQVEW